ncbi:hypothetical protein QNA24_30175 [Rhodococcus qingshengii]|uniref:hypothetical protein n=1 Tax=Rhodococcus TaxID=1827 RepID=UPI001E62DCDD|nr:MULTISPECIES: hypothetical protein [Rhodococcus]MCD2099518.1 hypothetical protein [Rhodococcus rhodochrous]MCD2123886.1 hypothetical protein [Rhodococcus rhodochrous]MCQ4136687.1 hypothetical protein [Rhodococcus rhodochrous]MDJ0490651.1 hypothetical protein [Rhodococcus qingshengii]
MALERMGSFDTLNELLSDYAVLARNPEQVFAGVVTRNGNGAVTGADVVWPNGVPGRYTATELSTTFAGATDAYEITYGVPAQFTFVQPAITRNASGYPTTIPAIEVL